LLFPSQKAVTLPPMPAPTMRQRAFEAMVRY
jgi:hypothetical protein